MIDSKKIAKNTVFMYFRMILVMLVSIYTSRVVLEKLGIDDFGLYNAVGSVVAIITFITNTLNSSTSRFFSYELGRNDKAKLNATFSNILLIYIVISFIIVLLLESVGLLYINKQFVIPDGRETSVKVVYQLSILIAIITFLEVPFTSSIISHEDFKIYAYLGILDVMLKLGIVYLLHLIPIDKLILYSTLLLISKLIITTIYVYYSYNKYEEVKFKLEYDSSITKGVFNFTGWTVVANFANSIVVQGSVLLMNLFFSPAVIAAKSLANQICTALMQFINNFRIAVNPQIIKSYSSGDKDESQTLLLQSTKLVFYLFLILCLPCIFVIEPLLQLWLVDVPPFAVEFTQLVLITQVFVTIDSSFYMAFVTSGKIKQISIWGMTTSLIYFIILFIIYKAGGTVLWVQYLYLINVLLWAFIIKPTYMYKIVGYSLVAITKCLVNCLAVFILSFTNAVLIASIIPHSIVGNISKFICIAVVTLLISFFFLGKQMRMSIFNFVKSFWR